MAIRITGMYSGLDTESIINELASAQSMKKTKLVKAQTKHSWKQDAWKALNTKIYSFYQKLDDMRLQGSYKKKKTTVSDPNAVKVVSGESTVDGVHTLRVLQLAKQAYLTSASLETDQGVRFRGGATLEKLGFTEEKGSISVNGALGQEVKIEVSKDMTIDEFVAKIKETGLNANFDEGNQRIYMSSTDTGKNANFFLSANDENGFKALGALGLLTEYDASNPSPEYQDYLKWQGYKTDGTAKQKEIDDQVAARAAAYKQENDELENFIKALEAGNKYNEEQLKKLDGFAEYGDVTKAPYNGDYAKLQEDLYKRIYGEERNKQATNDDGTPKFEADGTTPVYEQEKDADGNPKVDDDGNPVYVKERYGGMTHKLEELTKELIELQKAPTPDQTAIDAKVAEIKDQEAEIKKAQDCYDYVNAIAENLKMKEEDEKKIQDNKQYFTVDDSDPDHIKVSGTQDLIDDVTAEVEKKIDAADKFLTNAAGYTNGKTAHKIQGVDAQFLLNGVDYSSYNNTLTVNGMTITAMEQNPDKDITLSTTTDTDGVYDMIKDFFNSYNELVNEMDALYNADSAKDYEPLTSEEKDALSDTEIEEWEKKIKDSLLRRDSTLNTVSTAMRNVMLKGVNVNGTNMYLADFGIETLSYYKAKDNERNAYHILGNKDDPLSWEPEENRPDLRTMIATDPDAVMDFFVGLTNNMHDELAKQMSATKLSSALTVYNDRKMKEEYDEYTKKIKEQEEKLNGYMDKWYAKFSAMETALAKLESKNNSLSGLFGG